MTHYKHINLEMKAHSATTMKFYHVYIQFWRLIILLCFMELYSNFSTIITFAT